jgi:VanZ family protein
MAAIFVVSSIPDVQTIPGGFPDYTAHSAEYLVLSALLVRAIARAEWRRVTWRAALLAILASTAYALTDEWHQSFVPGRASEWRDVVSDAAGASIAAGSAWTWSIIRHFSRSRERRHGVHEPAPRA